jgi:hypothetical protein
VFTGTYSSIFIGGPILIYLGVRPNPAVEPKQRSTAGRWRPHHAMSGTGGGFLIEPARFPGRAPIEAYGNGGFRFADMSHRGSILALPSGIESWAVAEAAGITSEAVTRLVTKRARSTSC